MNATDEARIRETLSRITWALDAPHERSLLPFSTEDARITVREQDGTVVRFSAGDGSLDEFVTYRRAGAWLFDRQQWACDLVITGNSDEASAEAALFDIGWARGVRSNVILSSQVVRDRLVNRDGRWLLAHREIRPFGVAGSREDEE